MTDIKSFDPARHLMLLKGKDYLEVKWRLVWLRSEHPDAIIQTELLSHQNSMAVVQARVTIPGGGEATGLGMEDSQGFGDYLEKAETKAIGRALGALGYGTQFCEDHEFGGEQGKVVDAPVFRGNPRQEQQYPQAAREQSTNADTATERQVALIQSLAQDAGWVNARLSDRIAQAYGGDLYSMTRKQASSLIEELKGGQQTQNQTGGYANGNQRQQYGGADRSNGGGYAPKPASQPQKNRIFMLWKNRPELPTHEGAKHQAFKHYMGAEWEDMTSKQASEFMDLIEGGKIDPQDIAPF